MISTKNYEISVLKPKLEGLNFVYQNLSQNKYLNSGWFYIPKLWLWMYLVWYWLYNTISVIILVSIIIEYRVGKIAFLEIFSFWNYALFGTWIIHWLMVIYASSRWYTFEWQFILSFFTPFYAITFPIMVTYARFTRYKK